MQIQRLDHLVLTVNNIENTCRFYQENLGMKVVRAQNGRVSLHFGQQKINLHQKGHEFEPKAQYPTPGSADLCFITEYPIEQLKSDFQKNGVKIVAGPVMRNGAEGKIYSLYVRDPDQNLVEIANY